MRGTRVVLGVVVWLSLVTGGRAGASEAVKGNWFNPLPCVFTSLDAATGTFSCTGSSVWKGTWTGVTVFNVTGTLDPATGDSWGTVEEMFVGSADDGTTGTMRFAETYTVDGATFEIYVDIDIVDATDGFAGAQGSAVFQGLYPMAGGGGWYHGEWTP